MRAMHSTLTFCSWACSLLLLLVTPAAAQDKVVLGIELGAPFRIPACKAGETATASRPCFKSDLTTRKTNGVVEYFVANTTTSWPTYMRSDIHVMVLDGTVESVQYGTWGIETQDNALAALSKKYGAPTRLRRELQKGMRARIRTIFADWDLQGFSVRLLGSVGSIDWGRIEVSTPRYLKLAVNPKSTPP